MPTAHAARHKLAQHYVFPSTRISPSPHVGSSMCMCICVRVCAYVYAVARRCGGDWEKTLTSANTTAALAEGVICYLSPPLKHTISKQAWKMPGANKPLQILQGDRLPSQRSTPLLLPLKYHAEHLRAVDFRWDQVQARATRRGKVARLSLTFPAWVAGAATLSRRKPS